MENFLIIRLSSLGDIIHTLPAFSALRRHFPQAKIRWAVEEKGEEILDLVPGIDEVIVIKRKNWLPSTGKIRRRDQVALDFQGLIKSAVLAYLSCSRRRIGFHKKNLRERWAFLYYTERIEYVPEEETHVIDKNLKLLGPLGITEEKYDFPIRLPNELQRSVEAKLKETALQTNKKLMIFNLGAAWETKRWFAERWTELIERTKFEDASPLLLWGNETEKSLALKVKEKTGVPLSPFLTVQEVMALIKKASLLVSGDTFALQVACAFSVPVVGLFGPTNPRRNGPFRPEDRVIYPRLDCSPCYKRVCPKPECLQALKVEEVAAAVKAIWENRG